MGLTLFYPIRSSKDAPEVAKKISQKFGVESRAYQCDVGDEKLVTDTFKKIDDELGPVTGLIAVSTMYLDSYCC